MPGTILCVDDNEILLNILTLVLERAGYRTRQAKTGQEAIAAALHKPDLILIKLDIFLEAKVQFRCPVILMASHEVDDQVVAVMEANQDVVGFISKPALNVQNLEQIITAYLPQKQKAEVCG